tara:strand:+ start:187 stop:375 length:189 start_codon:yes stop_codon:yes gene_type:complete
MTILRRVASLLGVVGVATFLMHTAQNGNYARKELLKDISWWSLVGCLGSYLLCVYFIFRKIK